MNETTQSKRIVLTGGGTAGHVTPNIALLPSLRRAGYEISYIGSYSGIESRLIADYELPYYGISVGKMRRYFDLKNLTDPFRVIKGYAEAKKHLQIIKPHIVFSKGGFVGVPVVRAAASLGIPCIIHESDISPGLANKLCISAATVVCCNFPETVRLMASKKAVLTGSPIRDELRQGQKAAALTLCQFNEHKPVILVIGGSQGSQSINLTLRAALPMLLDDFQIIHICGKDNRDDSLMGKKSYAQYEYVKAELKDMFAAADLVISRAGANSICEILALQKPNLLIPLSAGSRGDQVLNARSFASQGFSLVINNCDLTEELLVDKIHEIYFDRAHYIEAMEKSSQPNSINIIMELIESLV
ncbi:MAG: undecaprenyldiphospho-muramoylpentapeptide beta-N-acetylglucosaminyltransferase [Lachnospiraceae bacterium]|nr:undecaprenyldiphospho-muramoylpentapeptide beta-N-acetylglucosaminyltransferase [Lachnospiraceae bacterium]